MSFLIDAQHQAHYDAFSVGIFLFVVDYYYWDLSAKGPGWKPHEEATSGDVTRKVNRGFYKLLP
jgi:hypothetical protein